MLRENIFWAAKMTKKFDDSCLTGTPCENDNKIQHRFRTKLQILVYVVV